LNTYFEPGERRATKVHDLFTRIARRYDLINDLQSFGLHRRWKRRVIELAKAAPGQQALDVCCGTGDLTLRFSRAGVRSTGLDFNEQMLANAQSKVQSLKSEVSVSEISERLLQFVRGDAQNLPFYDNTFDVVTMGYGLRNLADWGTGLTEMQRVAKPGGRVVVLEFGKPQNQLWRWIYFAYLQLFVPCLGLLCAGSATAYRYVLESLQHYPGQEGVAASMREMGFVNVRVVNLAGGAMSVNYGEKGEGELVGE
jgi:demethylmenaquinone methyltransferase/2-methoxy-6-polyprenyl-1,4-benzoquinol methylase